MTLRILTVQGDDARAVTTPEGWLEIKGAVIARAGVLEYMTGQGQVFRELRDPSVIHSADALASYEGRPVLLGSHPTTSTGAVTLADESNIDDLPVIGSLRNVRADVATDSAGKRYKVTRADVLIWHPEGIRAAREGVRQFSVGYRTAVDMSSGVYDGVEFDARQVTDLGNHLVLTSSARAGDVTEFRLDATDAVCVMTKGVGDMATYRIGEVEGEVADDLLPLLEARDSAFMNLQNELDAIKAEHADMMRENAEIKARIAELEAEGDMSDKDKDEEDMKGDSAAPDLDARINERVDLVDRARQVIGSDYAWSGKTDRDIRADTISAVIPSVETTGLTEDEIKGAYMVALANVNARQNTAQQVADATRPTDAETKIKGDARQRALRWYTDRQFRTKGGK